MALLLGVRLVRAQPGPEDCPTNLLQNAGFEAGFSARGRVEEVVGNSWTAWYEVLPGLAGINYAPSYSPRRLDRDGPDQVLVGLWSQEMRTEGGTHLGGLYQSASIPRNSQVYARVYARSVASGRSDDAPAGGYAVSIGLDPLGETDAHQARIVWTDPITLTGRWLPIELDAPMEGPAITLFLRGQASQPVDVNASWWDAVCLRALGPAGEPTQRPTRVPPPTRTLAPGEPSPTPNRATLEARATELVQALAATLTAAAAPPTQPIAPRATAPPPTEPGGVGDTAAREPGFLARVHEYAGLVFLGLAAFLGAALLAARRAVR